MNVVETPDVHPASVALSDVERRFDLARRSVGFFAGPIAFVIVLLTPFSDLSVEAHRLAAVVSLVVVWWITEAIPIGITAVAGVALATVLGVAPASEAFSQFGNPILFLFLGSFILARGVAEHGLDRRISRAVLGLPAVGASFARTRTAIVVLVFGLSAWISNAAATSMWS